jgi:hypothetical protein
MMGYYIFVETAIVAAGLNGMVLGSLGFMGIIFAFIGIGILYLAMKPVWNNIK